MREERRLLKDEADAAGLRRTARRLARCRTRASPSNRMTPASGRSRPAIWRRIVVLPAPDGPNSTSIDPGRRSTSRRASIAKPPANRCATATRSAAAPAVSDAVFSHTDRCSEYVDARIEERHDQQQQRRPRRRRVVERLHRVVDRDRHRPRDARQVAADHQHHAELAERVREAQDDAGDQAADRQRNHDAAERLEPRHAERPRRFEQPAIDRRELRRERLHRERHRVQHRRDQQPFERERQAMARRGARTRGRPDSAARSRRGRRNRGRSAAARAAARRPLRRETSSASAKRRSSRRAGCRSPAAPASSRTRDGR